MTRMKLITKRIWLMMIWLLSGCEQPIALNPDKNTSADLARDEKPLGVSDVKVSLTAHRAKLRVYDIDPFDLNLVVSSQDLGR